MKLISLLLSILVGMLMLVMPIITLAEETYFIFSDYTYSEEASSLGCGCGMRARNASCASRARSQPQPGCGCTSVTATLVKKMEESPATYAEAGEGGTVLQDTGILMEEPADTESWAQIFGNQPLRRVYDQEVKHLQIYLNTYMRKSSSDNNSKLTYLPENGMFDSATEDALRQFQLGQGLSEIGVVGEETKAALFELLGNLIY